MFLVFVIMFSGLILFRSGVMLSKSSGVLEKGIFMFDGLSFYTILLVIFLGVYARMSFFKLIGWSVQVILCLSLLFSILCFCANNVILF